MKKLLAILLSALLLLSAATAYDTCHKRSHHQ